MLTRAQARKKNQEVTLSDSMFPSVFSEDRMIDGGESTEMCEIGPETFATPEVSLPLTCEGLIGAQRSDPSLEKIFAAVVADSRGRSMFSCRKRSIDAKVVFAYRCSY